VAKRERGFEDLDCYKLALQVVREAYDLARGLPDYERYDLARQLRRAASSVTLNIAEGYGRYHYLDSLRFFHIARGSLSETLSGFITCQAVGYTSEADLDRQRELTHRALQALNGYIRYVRKQQQGQELFGNRLLHETEIEYESTNPKSTSPEYTNPDPKEETWTFTDAT
jgi:four helix bundle protein